MKTSRKFLCLLLCFVMLLSLMPTAVFAAGLGTPTNLRWDGMTIRWNAVAGANSYNYYLYKGDTCILSGFTPDTFSDCEEVITRWGTANYSFTVQAKTGTSTGPESGRSPVYSYTAPVVAYDVWVNGEQFTSEKQSIPCGTGYATYNPDTNTVTLAGAQITNVHDGGAIKANSPLTVVVESNSTINVGTKSGNGIYTYGALTLQGSGNLDIQVGNDGYDGIYAITGNVVLSGSGDVTIHSEGYGVHISDGGVGSLVFTGSGNADIYGQYNGVMFWDAGNEVRLNGTGSTITLRAGEGAKAVFNAETGKSPVVGTSIGDYAVTGNPASESVVYKAMGEPYNVWVNGARFYANMLTIPCGTGTATYDPATNTLTLDGAQITKSYDSAAIKSNQNLKIQVDSDSTISVSTTYGIYAEDNMTLKGTGNLTINKASYGMLVKGYLYEYLEGNLNITVSGNGVYTYNTMYINGGDVSISAGSSAIEASDDVEVKGSGKLTIVKSRCGIDAEDVRFSTSGDITINAEYCGIYASYGYISFAGSGKISIISEYEEAINLSGAESYYLLCLDGIYDSITLKAGEGYKAVYNRTNWQSPVAGMYFDIYEAVGAPDTSSVVYTKKYTPYNVWVNGEMFTSGKTTIACGSGTATLDVTTSPYTLTLENAEITGSTQLRTVGHSLKIVLKGTNTMTGPYQPIDAKDCDLTFTGTGSLTIEGGELYYGAIYAKSVVFDNAGDITILDDESYYSIFHSSVTFAGSGNVTIVSDSTAIYAVSDVVFSGSGEVSLTGGSQAIYFSSSGKKILLNGTNRKITLAKTGTYYDSVANGTVAGTNLDLYDVTGSLESDSIVFTLKKTLVKTVSITVDPPMAGRLAVAGNLQITTDQGADVVDMEAIMPMWMDADTEAPVYSTDYFESGRSYKLFMVIALKDGYAFDPAVTFTVNGESVDVAAPYYECYDIFSALMECVSAAPAAPTVTASCVASTGYPKLSWGAVEGAVSYNVYRATSKTGEFKLMKNTTNLSYTNTSAVAGKTYYYKVVAVGENGALSEESAVKTVTCDLAQPVVKATNVASTGYNKLTWEAIPGATAYKVYRSTSKTGTYTLMKTVKDGTSYVNSNAVAGTTYYYYVVAVMDGKDAATSAPSEIKISTCDLAQPVVKATNVASTGYNKLTWDAIPGATAYKVYRSTSKTGTFTLMKTVKDGTSYVNSNAVAGTTYYYYVVAVMDGKDAATSAKSEIKVSTCDLPQPTMTLTAGTGKITVKWDAISGATGYKIYRATAKDGTYTLVKTITSGTTVSWSNTGLTAGKTYYYKMVAVLDGKDAATSAYSAVRYTTVK